MNSLSEHCYSAVDFMGARAGCIGGSKMLCQGRGLGGAMSALARFPIKGDEACFRGHCIASEGHQATTAFPSAAGMLEHGADAEVMRWSERPQRIARPASEPTCASNEWSGGWEMRTLRVRSLGVRFSVVRYDPHDPKIKEVRMLGACPHVPTACGEAARPGCKRGHHDAFVD